MIPAAILLALLATEPVPTTANADGTTTVVPATGSGVFDYELRRVADGVYVAVRPDVFRQPVDGNVVFIVNERDVVAVDSGGTVASAESVIRLLRAVTNKPVRYVVNTHCTATTTWATRSSCASSLRSRSWPTRPPWPA